MNPQAKVTICVRHILISLLLIPLLMFFLPPSMELRLFFHGQTQEGIVNVYRSDDAVGYYFRSVFRVDSATTSAYMKGVYENLEELRVRFEDIREINLDGVTIDLYGLRVANMSGREMAEKMVVKKGVTVLSDRNVQGEGGTKAPGDEISTPFQNTASTVDNVASNADTTENSAAIPANNLATASNRTEKEETNEDSAHLKIAYDGAYFILAPCSYMNAGAWTYYFCLLYLLALFAALPVTAIFFLLGFKNPISEVLFFMMPAFAVSFGELACGSISAIPTRLFFLNYFAVLGIGVFLRFLTRRSFSTALTGVIFCCIYIANHFVYLFRGRPLLPWDLQAVGTAAEVAGAYDFELSGRLIALILAAVFVFVAPKLLKRKRLCRFDGFDKVSPFATKINSLKCFRLKNQVLMRAGGMALGILMISLVFACPSYAGLETEAWDASIIIDYQKQGMPMTFVKYVDVYRVSKPDGYGADVLKDIADTYGDSKCAGQKYFLPEDAVISTKPKRILMVMNESLSEISYANEEETVDTLPFLRSLKENSISGSLYVSVRGGGTCNTEFESLTASAMGLLPPNTYPFQAYLKRGTPSLATYFQNEGYGVAALHLADRKNWKRSTVYPYLGLDPFYAQNDFKEIETLRGYATDACDYKKLIELDKSMRRDLNQKNGMDSDSRFESSYAAGTTANRNTESGETDHAKRTFIYNVTMQNHGGYSPTDDMKVTVDLSEYGDFSQAEVYYSLMKLSDDALRELIGHYKEDDTDTMIVVYGDHQPSLGTKTDDFLFEEDPPALVKYETPFLIWANYELPTLEGYKMSPNYLPGLILEAAGFELTPYLRLLGDCYKEYPVITSYGVLDVDGNYYADADTVPDESGVLWRYRCAQYNNLFDNDRMEEVFKKK